MHCKTLFASVVNVVVDGLAARHFLWLKSITVQVVTQEVVPVDTYLLTGVAPEVSYLHQHSLFFPSLKLVVSVPNWHKPSRLEPPVVENFLQLKFVLNSFSSD